MSKIKKPKVALHNTVQPQFNERPRDSQNVFTITRFHYIEVLFHVYIADSIKASLAIGHWPSGDTERCNYLPESPPNNSFLVPNSQCPKQPLLNQPYFTITGVRKIVRYTEHFIISRFVISRFSRSALPSPSVLGKLHENTISKFRVICV